MTNDKSAGTSLPRACGFAVLGWLLATAGAAAAADAPAPVAAPANLAQSQTSIAITAHRLLPDERLLLDGTLAHPAWSRAPVFDDFVEKAPNTGGVPQHPTRVRVLFDAQAI